MKKIQYAKVLILLCIAVVIVSCNKDGIATIVIEDGQPSVAQMIVGQWNPNGWELTDSEGNVMESDDADGMPSLDFNEDGTVDVTGGSGSIPGGSLDDGNYDWDAYENESTSGGENYTDNVPYIVFGGQRWYIFQLTKSILIIYRFYGDYIIIYYFHRTDGYDGSGSDTDGGTDCPYQPQFSDDQRIVRIDIDINGYLSYQQVYLYEYDEMGRISSYSVGKSEDYIYYTWAYHYDSEKVTATMGDGDWTFEGYFNEDGYITEVKDIYNNDEYIVWYNYDENGYLIDGKTMNDYISISYDAIWNPIYIHYP